MFDDRLIQCHDDIVTAQRESQLQQSTQATRLLLSLASLFIGGAGTAEVHDHDPPVVIWEQMFERDPSGVRYVSTDGFQSIYSFARMRMNSGPSSMERLRQMLARREEVQFPGWPIQDCSDEHIACLRTGPFVFAVPRQGRSQGMSYVAEGQRFEIVSCQDDSCSVIDVRAICERWEGGECVPGNANSNESVHAYFSFDSALGITSIEFGPGARGQAAQRSKLAGVRGILAPPVS